MLDIVPCVEVNFCKFTNETRNGIEGRQPQLGLKFLAACNGTTAAGGYEMALCMRRDHTLTPLAGACLSTAARRAPGTVADARDRQRKAAATSPTFCTVSDGVQAAPKDWKLVMT